MIRKEMYGQSARLPPVEPVTSDDVFYPSFIIPTEPRNERTSTPEQIMAKGVAINGIFYSLLYQDLSFATTV